MNNDKVAILAKKVALEFDKLANPTLQKKGYVSREPNPEDARSRIVILTDKALEQKSELEQIGDKMEDDLTAVLSEEERQTLVYLLKKTLTRFEK